MSDGRPVEPRVGDRERDVVIDRLGRAVAEGRLSAQEHGDRVALALTARTGPALDRLVEDLPEDSGPPARRGGSAPARRDGTVVAVLGGASRTGVWYPAASVSTVSVMGGVDLDFRDAVVDGPDIVLTVVTVMGGVNIVVPEDWAVTMTGIAVMAGRNVRTPVVSAHPVVTLHVRGYALMGGIEVRQKPPGER